MTEPNIQMHQGACKDMQSPRGREQCSKSKKNLTSSVRNSDMADHRRIQKILVDVDHAVMSTISDNILTSVQEHTICHKCGNFDCSCLFECGDFEMSMEEESPDGSLNQIESDSENSKRQSFLNPLKEDNENYFQFSPTVSTDNELLDMLTVPDEFLDFPVKERDILNIYQKSENYELYFPCECDNQEIKSVMNLSDGTSFDNLIIEGNSNSDLVSDSVVIEKIQEAEHQALETGNLIRELKEKQRILLQKENLSDEDGERIQEYKMQIDEKLEYLESITRNVSHLIGLPSINQLNCQTKHSEIFEKVSELSNKLSETISSIVSVEKRKSRLDLIHIKSLTNNSCCRAENEESSFSETKKEEKSEIDNNLEIQEIFVAAERENSLREIRSCEETILKTELCDNTSVNEDINQTVESKESTELLDLERRLSDEKNIYEETETEKLQSECIDSVIPKDIESCEDLVKPNTSDSDELLKSKKSSASSVNVSKVIIHGSSNNFPKILLCDEPHGKSDQTFSTLSEKKNNPEVVMSLTGRLCESYSLQEKLAVQFGELEGGRYHIQEELLQRDDTVDSLQRKVSSLQSEVKLMAKENVLLTEKISYHNSHTTKSCPRCFESKSRPENKCEQFIMKMITDSNGPGYESQLEYQLSSMENEMRNIQQELDMVQQQRQLIEQQKELLKSKSLLPTNIVSEQEIIVLSEELKKLQEEYDIKMNEVNQLRHLADMHKHKAEIAVATRAEAEEKLKSLQQRVWQAEVDAKQVAAMKEELVNQEQELESSDQRLNDSKFEIEELKNLLQEQVVQVENYRNKYLQTQQLYEEQRRELESMEGENKHIKDTVDISIQRVKNQFQEKLQKLLPLAEVLNTAQRNLQDVQHKRCIAERHCDELTKEINEMKKHANSFLQDLEDRKMLLQKHKLELEKLQERLDGFTKENLDLKEEMGELKVKIARLEEIRDNNEKRYEEKSIELAKLTEKLAEIHNECSQQIERAKERSELLKLSMQNEISELEKQLAQSRAIANSAKRERDDIRQKMQCQINQLNDSFNLAKGRIQELQSHVIDLKASYNNALGKEDETESDHPYLEAN